MKKSPAISTAPQYSTLRLHTILPDVSQTTILSEDKGLNVRIQPIYWERERLANFIWECNLCMWGNKKRFTTERIKVVFVLLIWRMEPRTLEDMRVQEMMENKRGCTDSWDALAAQLKKDLLILLSAYAIIDSPVEDAWDHGSDFQDWSNLME